MGTELAIPSATPSSFDEMVRAAEFFADSGLFPSVKSPAAALTLMMLCQAEGINPLSALRRYHIINGQPSMRTDTMLAEFQRHGGTVKWTFEDGSVCEGIFTHPVHAPDGYQVVITMAEMRKAGVADKNPNYAKWPKQMLKARAISHAIRAVLPGVVMGIYTPEEMQDFDRPPPEPRRDHRETIDVEEVRPRKPAGELSGRDAVNATFAPPVAPPSTAPAGNGKPADGRRWDQIVNDACKHANDSHSSDCEAVGIEPKPVLSPFQVDRHLLKWAVASGAPDPEPADSDGKRKRIGPGRVSEIVADLYGNDAWRKPMRAELAAYAKAKLAEATRQVHPGDANPAEDESQERPDGDDQAHADGPIDAEVVDAHEAHL